MHIRKHLQSYLFKYFRVQYTYFSLIILLILLLSSQNPHMLGIFYILHFYQHLNLWPGKITCNQPRGTSTLPCRAMAHSHKWIWVAWTAQPGYFLPSIIKNVKYDPVQGASKHYIDPPFYHWCYLHGLHWVRFVAISSSVIQSYLLAYNNGLRVQVALKEPQVVGGGSLVGNNVSCVVGEERT